MTVCQQLSDRMPAVAAGEQWTAAEAAHLAGCGDCAAEWAVVAATRQLGADLPGLNAHQVSERVLGRLRVERATVRARRRGLAFAGLAAAAAIAVAVWTGRPAGPAGGRSGSAAAADLSLVELDSLRAPELEALLHSMDRTDDGDPLHAVPGVLDDGELDRVLEALEG
jgi:hypothetical protein